MSDFKKVSMFLKFLLATETHHLCLTPLGNKKKKHTQIFHLILFDIEKIAAHR